MGWEGSTELRTRAFDFLSRASACTSLAALDEEFMRLAQAFGFKAAGLIRLLEAGGAVEPKVIFGSAPMDWINRYAEREYGRLDPTLPLAFQSRKAFTWKRAEGRERDIEVRNFFGEAREMFAKDSFIVPVWGPYGELSVVNLLSDEPLEMAEDERTLLQGLCSLYAAIGLSLADPGLPPPPEEATSLSRREAQCVYWTAMGKHDQEIAIILGISPLTVRDYLDAARTKLNVTTRPQLIRKAMTLGLLMPDRAMFR
ncbi:MAG TPA: LuxR family transcriptional regulator [Caulobacteraceae bacterium]|nr:LuxR family transcriptional regulator [Caulobacteraceae bacterium]